MNIVNNISKPTTVCTVCGELLHTMEGTPWCTAGITNLPVCVEACLKAFAVWKTRIPKETS